MQDLVEVAVDGPAGLVDEVVVVDEAQEDQVGQAGGAAVVPGLEVGGGAPRGGAGGGGQGAAGEAAAVVTGGEGAALGRGFGAVAAADVQGQAVAPADDRDLSPA